MARSFDELRAGFGSKAPTSLKDFAVLVGKPNTVRVNGFGVRGLRWAVEKVDEKTSLVTVSCFDDNKKKIVEQYTVAELTIVTTDNKGSRPSRLIGFGSGN